MPKIRSHVIVTGWVQGVFFRATLRENALSQKVTGWVRNNSDGSVEAVFEGDVENVEKLVKWCRRGPRGAAVQDVRVKAEEYTGEFPTFSITYSKW